MMYIFLSFVQTLNEVEKKMKKRLKLKAFVLPMIYTTATLVIVLSAFFLTNALQSVQPEEEDLTYVSNVVAEQEVPVVNTEKTIIRPYSDSAVTIARYFYDSKAEQEKQQNALIYYENTYMQNSGADYTLDTTFDVLAVLDGTVLSVEDNELLGKTVKIRHENDLISVYQSLSEVAVKKDDTVTQGQMIGKSGTNTLDSNLGNHLHFEIYYQGQVMDPEAIYNKKMSDL